MKKRKPFRRRQKFEIGYDLATNYTGAKGGTAMTTSQGEMMSNYFENSENTLSTKKK